MTRAVERYEPLLPWAEFHTDRLFCVTADQDWAPEWAMDFFFAWVGQFGVRPHVFTTNTSVSLQTAVSSGRATLGWHPNFAPGSTHGDDPNAVVEHLQAIAPTATTFRTHRFSESSDALEALVRAGHTVGSQFPTRFSAGITPLVHANSLVILPVWFEDDVWMRDSARADKDIAGSIDTPGLKILNLHPVHIALNAPDFGWYDQRREAIYDPRASALELTHAGRGARIVAEEILGVATAASDLTEFPAIAERALELGQSSENDDRLG